MVDLNTNTPADLAYMQRILGTPRPLAHWDCSTLSALADGAGIFSIADLTGNGLDMWAEGSSTLRPTKATDASGLAVARFNGSQKFSLDTIGSVEPSTETVSAPATIVLVVRPVVAASQTFQSITLLNGSGTNAPLLAILNATGQNTGQLYVGGNALSNNSGQFMPSLLDGNLHVIVIAVDTAVTTVYVDGYYVSTIAGNILGTALTQPQFGRSNGNTNYFVGDFAEGMIMRAKMTPKEVLGITAMLSDKWDIGLSLYEGSTAGSFQYEDGSTSDGSNYRIYTPAKPDMASPTLVLWCHPQAADRAITPAYFAYPYARTAMGLGWYFAASDMGFSGSPGGSASSWGNATAQNALLLLYNLMVSRIGSAPNVVLLAASMGACAAALAVAKETLGAGRVKAVYLIDPAVSLFGMYQTSYYSSIDSGYGITSTTLSADAAAGATSISMAASFAAGTVLAVATGTSSVELVTVGPAGPSGSGPYTLPLTTPLVAAHASGVRVSDYGTKTAGNDPMLIATDKFSNLPLRQTASSADTITVKTVHADAFKEKMEGIAQDNTITVHKGGHLAGGATNPRDFVQFVKTYLN